MKPIAIYPSRFAHWMSAMVGSLVLGFVAFDTNSGTDGISLWRGLAGSVGFAIIAFSLLRLSHPRPFFQADANGFAINRGDVHPWAAYGGVTVRSLGLGPLPIVSWTVLKIDTQDKQFEQRVKINLISRANAPICAEIETYCGYAQRADALAEALSALPAEPLTGEVCGTTACRRANPMPTAAYKTGLHGNDSTKPVTRWVATMVSAQTFSKLKGRMIG